VSRGELLEDSHSKKGELGSKAMRSSAKKETLRWDFKEMSAAGGEAAGKEIE